MRWLTAFIEYELTDNQKLALVFVKEVGAIDNQSYRQLTGRKLGSASRELSGLVTKHLVRAKKHGSQTYYLPSDEMERWMDKESLSTDPEGLSTDPEGLSTDPEGLSTELQMKISSIGKRTRDKEYYLILQ